MSIFLRYLKNEHGFEHDFEHTLKEKKKYSEPKIYDANGDLAKRWYVQIPVILTTQFQFKVTT